MNKIRVYKLAKECGITSKELIVKLAEMGIEVTNHMSTLTEDEHALILKKLASEKDKKKNKAKEAPVKKALKNKSKKKKETGNKEKEEVSNKKPKTWKKQKRGTKSQYKKGKTTEKESVEGKEIGIDSTISMSELANILQITTNALIMKFMQEGQMKNINSSLTYDEAADMALNFDVILTQNKTQNEKQQEIFDYSDDEKDLSERAPVVTVMGHVDHGKTSLLDAIRNTQVTKKEAGGITQHIGASEIYYNNKKIVFLDTPGHEAFTTLRARGAMITDIAILVVAADDGVKPQTIEAIHHAKDAGVPMIVAINKMDKPGVNPQRVKQELTEHEVLVEDWGGDVISVNVSALTGENIEELMEMILLVSEMLELKANSKRLGIGTIIEANLDKTMGATASVLLEKGTMKVGDYFFVGSAYGKVRTMINSKGKRIKKAGPSSAFKITGLSDVPMAGDKIYVTEDDSIAKEHAEKNALVQRKEKLMGTQKVASLENLFDGLDENSPKELNVIIRTDVHGSLEAIVSSLEKLNTEEVRVNVVKSQVGAITEADILLATASKAIILGFNVRPSNAIVQISERENVEIRTYRIIYNLINEIKDALSGMLDPTEKEEVEGSIEVRDIFKIPGIGTIAGGYVQKGKISRSSLVRLIRDGIVIYEGNVSSLKRFKDDAKVVQSGFECGIGLEKFNDVKVGDIIETFNIIQVKRSL